MNEIKIMVYFIVYTYLHVYCTKITFANFKVPLSLPLLVDVLMHDQDTHNFQRKKKYLEQL